MGTWGTGLYADDFALDLRNDIAAISRLPISGTEILNLLLSAYDEMANDPANDEHSRFWLVVADQFRKRNIRQCGAYGARHVAGRFTQARFRDRAIAH